jgi:hypothetical protein
MDAREHKVDCMQERSDSDRHQEVRIDGGDRSKQCTKMK